MSKETLGIFLAIIGLAVAFVLYLIDKSGKSTPVITVILLLITAGLFIWAILILPWVWTPQSSVLRIWRVSAVSCVVLLLVVRFAIWIWPPRAHPILDTEERSSNEHQKPSVPVTAFYPKDARQLPKALQIDVKLRFVYPKEPALVITNPCGAAAKNIKWTVALWNMDLPDRNDPLPIPVSIFDWIKPHEEGGPQNLFSSPLVAPLLKPGNRLFGSASVDCPECVRGRTYVVYIVLGSGGWFSEMETEKSGDILIPKNFLKESREEYFKSLEAAVPVASRLPIAEK